jgi:hypothetical protein
MNQLEAVGRHGWGWDFLTEIDGARLGLLSSLAIPIQADAIVAGLTCFLATAGRGVSQKTMPLSPGFTTRFWIGALLCAENARR